MAKEWVLRVLSVAAIFLTLGCGKLKFNSSGDEGVSARPIEELDEPIDENSATSYVQECRSKLKASSVAKEVAPRHLTDGPYRWVTIPYTIDARSETIQLFAKVTLDLQNIPAEERDHYWRRMQNVRQCVRDFYLRHDIFLQLEWIDSKKPEAAPAGDASHVTLRKKGVRVVTFNMNNWVFEADGKPLTDEVACTVVTHEFGHMLGLRDEYVEAGIPRRIGETNSVMRTCHVAPEEAKLYSRHLRTILKGACKEKAVNDFIATKRMKLNPPH